MVKNDKEYCGILFTLTDALCHFEPSVMAGLIEVGSFRWILKTINYMTIKAHESVHHFVREVSPAETHDYHWNELSLFGYIIRMQTNKCKCINKNNKVQYDLWIDNLHICTIFGELFRQGFKMGKIGHHLYYIICIILSYWSSTTINRSIGNHDTY